MKKNNKNSELSIRETSSLYGDESLSPFKQDEWLSLTPYERIERSWALRSRIPDLQALHDSKLFPKP